MRSKEEILAEYMDLKTLGNGATKKIFDACMDEWAKEVAGDMLREMKRYLPLFERAERNPEVWDYLTSATGIATLNGYRNAIEKIEKNLSQLNNNKS